MVPVSFEEFCLTGFVRLSSLVFALVVLKSINFHAVIPLFYHNSMLKFIGIHLHLSK